MIDKERWKRHQKERREYINNYKLSKGCSLCGYNKCAKALVFHHVKGNKDFEIAQSFREHMSLEKIKTEIDKCIVLCCRCHTELHERERK